MSNTFQTLSKVEVSKNIEKRKSGYTDLSYLSWSFAWSKLKETFPSANYKVKEYEGKPYLFDENLGYLVTTEVTIENETISMSLPVMDGANKAMKASPYTYEVGDWQWDSKSSKKVKVGIINKIVEQATMFDINKATMRCLVKNIAMFGLGITLYLGDDLPESIEIKSEATKAEQEKKLAEIHLKNANDLLVKINNGETLELEKVEKWFKDTSKFLPENIKTEIKLYLEASLNSKETYK